MALKPLTFDRRYWPHPNTVAIPIMLSTSDVDYFLASVVPAVGEMALLKEFMPGSPRSVRVNSGGTWSGGATGTWRLTGENQFGEIIQEEGTLAHTVITHTTNAFRRVTKFEILTLDDGSGSIDAERVTVGYNNASATVVGLPVRVTGNAAGSAVEVTSSMERLGAAITSGVVDSKRNTVTQGATWEDGTHFVFIRTNKTKDL